MTPLSRSGVPKLSVQVFAGDDVGGRHRPVFRNFDVLLLEQDLALGAGDLGRTQLPLDFVVGGNAGIREKPPEIQSRSLFGVHSGIRGLLGGNAASRGLLRNFGHLNSPYTDRLFARNGRDNVSRHPSQLTASATFGGHFIPAVPQRRLLFPDDENPFTTRGKTTPRSKVNSRWSASELPHGIEADRG